MSLGAIALLLCTGLSACAYQETWDGHYKCGNNMFTLYYSGTAVYFDGATGNSIYGTWEKVDDHTVFLHIQGNDKVTSIDGKYVLNYYMDKLTLWYEDKAFVRYAPGPI